MEGNCPVDVTPQKLILDTSVPGYLAMSIAMPATAIALGSAVALIPALGYSFLILLRILGEDRFLKESLPRYSRYSELVRYRLIPGLWWIDCEDQRQTDVRIKSK